MIRVNINHVPKQWINVLTFMLFTAHCHLTVEGNCNAHLDASCLQPIPQTICRKNADCKKLHHTVDTRVDCVDSRCRVVLICPDGYFSWNGGCLPYATVNQKCPAGSQQCVQGLLCVDGVCLGACREGEVLVHGVCRTMGQQCIDRDCEVEGCPPSYPICTLDEDSASCCKPKIKKPRPPPSSSKRVPWRADDDYPDSVSAYVQT
uniref:EB domain-containing protein n=1 Tax=Panagrellus redivivus TaxID=6233 RepID=A0A7E4UYW2_PANRE